MAAHAVGTREIRMTVDGGEVIGLWLIRLIYVGEQILFSKKVILYILCVRKR